MENIDAPDLRVIDATWFAPFTNPPETGYQAYMRAHIPDAVYFDIDAIADPDSDLPHTFPPSHVFSSRVRKLGLGDGNRLVVYDQNGFFAAARVWWMFRAMGFSDVLVLDGGLQAWIEAGGEVDDIPPVAVERHLTPRVRADLLKTKAQMAALVEKGGATIIDARPAGRFTGEAPEPREGLSSGHIPGSVNLPGSELIENGTLKSAEALRNVFTQAGIDPDKPIVTSCGSGVTAAITALALAVLGNDLVAVYDGSWTEWALDNNLPIATGPAT
jgi:thiosulfate/3-mercaptopyruvate sulfurtransferase